MAVTIRWAPPARAMRCLLASLRCIRFRSARHPFSCTCVYVVKANEENLDFELGREDDDTNDNELADLMGAM